MAASGDDSSPAVLRPSHPHQQPEKAKQVIIQLHSVEDGYQNKNFTPNKIHPVVPTERSNPTFLEALTGKAPSKEPVTTDSGNSDFDFADLKSPTIIEGRHTVLFGVSEQVKLACKYQYALIGKFSHGKPTWKKIIAFFNLLKLKAVCQVSVFDSKHIYIICSCKEDFNRLWLRLVWTIDSFAMRIFKWEPKFSALKESSIAPVWIRFEGLPLFMFDKKPLLDLSNAIGKPICVDNRNLNGTMLNSARVCVELDVAKPLVDLITLGFVNDSNVIVEEKMVQVFYDLLPSYCCKCWHLGHHQDSCKRSIASLASHSQQGPGQKANLVAEMPISGPGTSDVVKAKGIRNTKKWIPKEAATKEHNLKNLLVSNNFAALDEVCLQDSGLQQQSTQIETLKSDNVASYITEPTEQLNNKGKEKMLVDNMELNKKLRNEVEQLLEHEQECSNVQLTKPVHSVQNIDLEEAGKLQHYGVDRLATPMVSEGDIIKEESPPRSAVNTVRELNFSKVEKTDCNTGKEMIVWVDSTVNVDVATTKEGTHITQKEADIEGEKGNRNTGQIKDHADSLELVMAAESGQIDQSIQIKPPNGIAQEWKLDGKKNNKAIGVVTRSQMKTPNNTWADQVEGAQTVEQQTPITNKKKEEYKARQSSKIRRKEVSKLSNRINKIASRLKDKSLRDDTKRKLQEELEALKDEHSRIC